MRTSDGRTYETVQIASFLPARAESEFVHGIHLRSGLRSYHANGYLVVSVDGIRIWVGVADRCCIAFKLPKDHCEVHRKSAEGSAEYAATRHALSYKGASTSASAARGSEFHGRLSQRAVAAVKPQRASAVAD